MHYILRLQQMHAVFFFYMRSEGAHAHVFYYVFSDFISFGPNLEVYNIIYLALYSL